MKNSVKTSRDYSLFIPHEVNRKVDESRVGFKRLLASMKMNGWLSAYPMHCIKGPGGKLKIKGGHHRFRAAQILGIPVKYVVESDSIPIHELERTGGGIWKSNSFLYSHARQGISEYIELQKFIEDTGITLPLAASMFFGDTAGSGNYSRDGKFQLGNFKFKDTKHPYTVGNLVTYLRGLGVSYSHEQCFVIALSKAVRVPAFSPERFKKKAKQATHLFEKKRTVQDYLLLIEEVFNYRMIAKSKQNIVFQANQISAERKVALFTKKTAPDEKDNGKQGHAPEPRKQKERPSTPLWDVVNADMSHAFPDW